MKKINTIISIILAASLFVSCEDFLNDAPSKSTSVVPQTVEELDYLFNNYLKFKDEDNINLILASDAFDLNMDLTLKFSNYPGFTNALFALWDTDNIPSETYARYTNGESYFSSEYRKIFIANTVLRYIPDVKGSDDMKVKLEREAKFIRAYSMWNLAQTYCLPYSEANKNEPGLILKNSTSFEESTKRATLEETYQYIEENLTAALEITNNMEIVNGNKNSVRANKAGVNGFAARYWLNRNDYEKALKYANEALSSHNSLMDYNTRMSYYQYLPSFPSTWANSNINYRIEWNETLYMRDARFSYWYDWKTPSQKLLNLYDHQYDLRYQYHIVDNYAFDYWGLTNISCPGYVFFYNSVPSGPSTAEMILIKAECLARQNKISEAMTEVNKLRDVRMLSSAPESVKHLNASTKAEAVRVILEERMREMPFSQRWNDIRRLNHNEDPADDVGDLTRTYFPYNASTILTSETPVIYTLRKGSRRYAVPLPQSDILASGGVIEQNKY